MQRETPPRKNPKRKVGRGQVEAFVGRVFEEDVRATRVASLTNNVDGALHAASVGIRAIGQGSRARGGSPPSMPSSRSTGCCRTPGSTWRGSSLAGCRSSRARTEIVVNVDRIELLDSGQAIVTLGTQTGHGRSTPLVWMTVTRSALKDQRNGHEDELPVLFASVLPVFELSAACAEDR